MGGWFYHPPIIVYSRYIVLILQYTGYYYVNEPSNIKDKKI